MPTVKYLNKRKPPIFWSVGGGRPVRSYLDPPVFSSFATPVASPTGLFSAARRVGSKPVVFVANSGHVFVSQAIDRDKGKKGKKGKGKKKGGKKKGGKKGKKMKDLTPDRCVSCAGKLSYLTEFRFKHF